MSPKFHPQRIIWFFFPCSNLILLSSGLPPWFLPELKVQRSKCHESAFNPVADLFKLLKKDSRRSLAPRASEEKYLKEIEALQGIAPSRLPWGHNLAVAGTLSKFSRWSRGLLCLKQKEGWNKNPTVSRGSSSVLWIRFCSDLQPIKPWVKNLN